MGVDTRRFSPRARDQRLRQQLGIAGPFLLFVGRLAEKKGVRYLLEAMPGVLERFPDAKLVIVGDGPLREELKAFSAWLGIAESVVFAGGKRQEELPPYYASADVFIGPSIVARGGDTESFGLVFAEAMAAGCAVVASDVGGVRELVRDGKTGLLVAQRDAQAIARAVCGLLADPELRRRLSAAGRSLVMQQFEQGSVTDRYARVLQEAAA
jgi:glycosyltransferase involved in cell wall biosynthesis